MNRLLQRYGLTGLYWGFKKTNPARNTRMWIGLAFLAFLPACTISSGQLNSVKALFTPKYDSLAEFRWNVNYEGVNHAVVAIVKDGVVVFSDPNEGVIRFDGWVIRRFEGFSPGLTPVTLRDYGSTRVIRDSYDSLEIECGPWQSETQEDQTVVYSQSCTEELGEGHEARLTVSAQGALVRIEQVIDPAGQHVILTKQTATTD